MSIDYEIFEGKSLSSLFEDIYKNTEYNRKQLDVLTKELVQFINKKRGTFVPLFCVFDSVGLSNYFVPTYEINPPTPTRRRVQRNQIRRTCL